MDKAFRQQWANQTELGSRHGMTAVAFGKWLVKMDLRDARTREPTEKALQEGFAISTPLKDGTKFFMWNRAKIGSLMKQNGVAKVSERDRLVAELSSNMLRLLRNEDAIDTALDLMSLEDLIEIDRVPRHLRDDVLLAVKDKIRPAFEKAGYTI